MERINDGNINERTSGSSSEEQGIVWLEARELH